MIEATRGRKGLDFIMESISITVNCGLGGENTYIAFWARNQRWGSNTPITLYGPTGEIRSLLISLLNRLEYQGKDYGKWIICEPTFVNFVRAIFGSPQEKKKGVGMEAFGTYFWDENGERIGSDEGVKPIPLYKGMIITFHGYDETFEVINWHYYHGHSDELAGLHIIMKRLKENSYITKKYREKLEKATKK